MLPMKINPEDYSPEKLLAAQLLATKDDNQMTDAQIASEVQVDLRTIYRWKNDPQFVDLLLYYSELSMEVFVPELYQSLKRAVRQGSTRAMELVLKNRGRLIDKKEVSGNLGLSVEQTHDLTQDILLVEIEELKKKVKQMDGQPRKAIPPVVDAEFTELEEGK